jgi:hypothetical protein
VSVALGLAEARDNTQNGNLHHLGDLSRSPRGPITESRAIQQIRIITVIRKAIGRAELVPCGAAR